MVVWPEYISLNYWAATLVDNYPSSPLPILDKDENWQDWAAAVAATPPFSTKGISAPFSVSSGSKVSTYENWQDWAKMVYISML